MDLLEALALLAVGFAIGTYSAAVGAGGGFLITPLLLIRYPEAAPATVTAASLTVVFATSVSQVLLASRERRMDAPVVGAMAAVAIPAALFGALGTTALPREVFAIGFAVLITAIAIYILVRPTAGIAPPFEGRAWARDRTDAEGDRYLYRIPVVRSIVPNILSAGLAAMAGIGGGPIGVPLMTRIMRVPHAIAVPSMHLLILFQSAAVVLLHLALGNLGDPMEDVPWLAAGVILAAAPGRLLRRRLGEGPLMQALALGLFVVAARTAWGAFH
ncbi:MAG: sulfite exporter TauE/SafE family protein [Dehalococcoidia bacterium]